MNSVSLELPDVAAHVQCAHNIATLLRGGDIVALRGELGAGKTTMAAAIGQSLGVEDVTSPTFGVIHEHERSSGGRFLHVDAYRLAGGEELIDLGWDEWAGASDVILCVEWADRIETLLAVLPCVCMHLSHAECGRSAVIHWEDKSRLAALAACGEVP